MEEQANQDQAAPVAEAPQEVQRNLTLTVIETAAALKLADQVVPDLYEGAKSLGKAGLAKLHGNKPDAGGSAGDSQTPD